MSQRPSIKRRRQNGRWVYRFQWREGAAKKTKIWRCSEFTKMQVEDEAKAILNACQTVFSQPASPTMTLRQYVDREYLEVMRRQWKRSTRATTEQRIEHDILAPLGHRLLHAVTRRELQSHLDSLAAAGKSRSLVDHVHSQLQAIFGMALTDRLIPVNPVKGVVTPPCKQPNKKRVMTAAQLQQAQMCLPIRERLLLRLGTIEGLRPGEITGLQIEDLTNEGLQIRRRIYEGQVDIPKTGERSVALTPGTRDLLEEWVKNYLLDTTAESWVFPSETRVTPIRYSNVLQDKIRPALAKIGLGWATFQVMRRTAATEQRKQAKDAKVAADQMGHSLRVQQNVYAQSSMKQKQRLMKRVGDRLQ